MSKQPGRNWKTTTAGIVGGLMMLLGPRLSGDRTQPAITLGSLAQAAAIAAIGYFSKDHDLSGGTRQQ